MSQSNLPAAIDDVQTESQILGIPANRDARYGDCTDDELGRAKPSGEGAICTHCNGYGGYYGTCVTCHGSGLLPKSHPYLANSIASSPSPIPASQPESVDADTCLNTMVRDFTEMGSRPKSEVRRRIVQYAASLRGASQKGDEHDR